MKRVYLYSTNNNNYNKQIKTTNITYIPNKVYPYSYMISTRTLGPTDASNSVYTNPAVYDIKSESPGLSFIN